jgi:hypothetical protein
MAGYADVVTTGAEFVLARMDARPGMSRTEALDYIRASFRLLGSPYADREAYWQDVDAAVSAFAFTS